MRQFKSSGHLIRPTWRRKRFRSQRLRLRDWGRLVQWSICFLFVCSLRGKRCRSNSGCRGDGQREILLDFLDRISVVPAGARAMQPQKNRIALELHYPLRADRSANFVKQLQYSLDFRMGTIAKAAATKRCSSGSSTIPSDSRTNSAIFILSSASVRSSRFADRTSARCWRTMSSSLNSITVRAGFRKYRAPAVLHSLRGVRLANKKNGGGLIDTFQLGLGPA
jgi:hypothetical protein